MIKSLLFVGVPRLPLHPTIYPQHTHHSLLMGLQPTPTSPGMLPASLSHSPLSPDGAPADSLMYQIPRRGQAGRPDQPLVHRLPVLVLDSSVTRDPLHELRVVVQHLARRCGGRGGGRGGGGVRGVLGV